MIKTTSEEFRSLGKKIVVVLNIGGTIETDSWKKYADSILLAWQGGQEGGNSVIDITYSKLWDDVSKTSLAIKKASNNYKVTIGILSQNQYKSAVAERCLTAAH